MTYEATIRGVGVTIGEEGVGAPAIILDVRDVVIPIFVDPGQAQTIERARQDVPAERPMTHDLFVDVLADAGVDLDQVRIDDLTDGTFYAKLDLVLNQADGEEKVVRDARPSDGIALAVRVGCSIQVATEVINEAGQPPETLGIDGTGQPSSRPEREGAGFNIDSEASAPGGSEEPEPSGFDDAVEIEFEDSEESAEDDDSES